MGQLRPSGASCVVFSRQRRQNVWEHSRTRGSTKYEQQTGQSKWPGYSSIKGLVAPAPEAQKASFSPSDCANECDPTVGDDDDDSSARNGKSRGDLPVCSLCVRYTRSRSLSSQSVLLAVFLSCAHTAAGQCSACAPTLPRRCCHAQLIEGSILGSSACACSQLGTSLAAATSVLQASLQPALPHFYHLSCLQWLIYSTTTPTPTALCVSRGSQRCCLR